MPNEIKSDFLTELARKYGPVEKLGQSLSLYEIGQGKVRIYIRYSQVHDGDKTFYGLRQQDLRLLAGHAAFICFLWDEQKEPLFVPFAQYEEVFQSMAPASDGQYKVQVYLSKDGTELYIARAGRFNVESHFGWAEVASLIAASGIQKRLEFTHSQIQALLGRLANIKDTKFGFRLMIGVSSTGPIQRLLRLKTSFPPHLSQFEK